MQALVPVPVQVLVLVLAQVVEEEVVAVVPQQAVHLFALGVAELGSEVELGLVLGSESVLGGLDPKALQVGPCHFALILLGQLLFVTSFANRTLVSVRAVMEAEYRRLDESWNPLGRFLFVTSFANRTLSREVRASVLVSVWRFPDLKALTDAGRSFLTFEPALGNPERHHHHQPER